MFGHSAQQIKNPFLRVTHDRYNDALKEQLGRKRIQASRTLKNHGLLGIQQKLLQENIDTYVTEGFNRNHMRLVS